MCIYIKRKKFLHLQQQHNDGGEDSQDNVDDQHPQPQRPMRRQMRRPFFRQYYRGPSRLPPRNVDQDRNDVCLPVLLCNFLEKYPAYNLT